MFTNAASQLTARLFSVAALALTPSAAHAADPPRPLSYPIVEWGGPGHSAEVFVHGTHGANNFVSDSAEGLVLVRSLKGERIAAGNGCRWSDKWQSVGCARPYKVNVFLHGAADKTTVKESARWNIATDVWAGRARTCCAPLPVARSQGAARRDDDRSDCSWTDPNRPGGRSPRASGPRSAS